MAIFSKTASGVPYYGYRYYDPELGRFLNRDPLCKLDYLFLGSSARAHPLDRDPAYVFVRNSPVSHIDAHGLKTERWPASTRCDCSQEDIMKGGCAAAKAAFDAYNAKREEGCGRLCCNKKTGEVKHTGPVEGRTRRKVRRDPKHGIVVDQWKECNPGWAPTCRAKHGVDFHEVGNYHSHPEGAGEDFSGPDMGWGRVHPFFLWGTGGCKVIDPLWEHVSDPPTEYDRPSDTVLICDVNPDTGEVTNCREVKKAGD